MIINTSSYTSAIPVALSDTINIPGPVVRVSGTTTATTPNNDPKKLIDTKANFVTTYDADGNVTNQGVGVGMIVYNMKSISNTDWLGPEAAVIEQVIDNNTLLLSADLFPFAGGVATEDYNIYDANKANPKGFIIQVGSAEDGSASSSIYVKTIDGMDIFIPAVQPGTVLPLVVQRVMVGTAADTSSPNTETNAENIIAYT
jgi:hypothetical protein